MMMMKVDGEIVSSFGQSRTQSSDRMRYPTGLAVSQNDVLLVADTNNNRLVSIDSERGAVLEVALPVVDGLRLTTPLCLCLDTSRDRLYVGGEGRVWLVDNARLVF